MRTALVSFLTATTLTACSQPLPVLATHQQILGGAADHEHPQVVALFGRSASGPGQNCSAFVVSPHVLVTAAHCVSPDIVGPDPFFKIFLGSDSTDPIQAGQLENYVPIAETHFDSEFQRTAPTQGHDIAVAITANALSIPPLPMLRTALDPASLGQPLRIVGYGQTVESDPDSIGVRYQVLTTVSGLDGDHLTDDRSGSTFCHGDSGGAEIMTVDGVETAVGVVSRRQRVASDSICGGSGWGTRVDRYADAFIAPFVEAADPAPLAAGAGDAGDAASPASAGCSAVPSSGRRAQASWPLLLIAGLHRAALTRRRSRRQPA